MKIVFDTETCKKDGKDIDVVLYLLSLLSGCPITLNTFEKARQQGRLKLALPYDRRYPFPANASLSETGEYVAESLMADSNVENQPDERFVNLAKKLQELFPMGKKPGCTYTWRDSVSCIVDRLKKFFLKYGSNYTDEQIINATKEYVNSFNGDYQYMQLLKYFIWKNKVTGEKVIQGRIIGEVEKQSQLAAYLENTPEKTINHDWDVGLR